jgi:hypothetical protein
MLHPQTATKLDFDRLSPDVTRVFAESGVVCLRALLDEAQIEFLREWIDIALKNPSPRFASKPDRTYAVDTHLWPRLDGFRQIAFESGIAEAAATVMGSREVRLYNDTLFVKEPSAPEPTPWHQDLPYFRLGGPNNCSAWIALDPANEASGAMSYGLGSHRWEKMFRPVEFDKPEHAFAEAGYDGPPPDLDLHPTLCETVSFGLRPGDVVFHHLLTLHKAGPNTSKGTRRRVHTLRLAGDDSIWVNRLYSTVEFKSDLPDGAPLTGEEFPILWPRSAQMTGAEGMPPGNFPSSAHPR